MSLDFDTRFPDMDIGAFTAGGQVTLEGYVPTESQVNLKMFTDIGKATIYGPESQDNAFARYLRKPLSRGDSAMVARFSQVNSKRYNPLAPDSALFDGDRPEMVSNVHSKNFSRQIRMEVNSRWMKQFVQTDDMQGNAVSAIMANSNACFRDDMYAASVEYFGGSVRGAKPKQMVTLEHKVGDAGFAEEIAKKLWDFTNWKFKYKSTEYNKTGYFTKSEGINVTMAQGSEFDAFNLMYAKTYNPEFLEKVVPEIKYVESFPSAVAGKPAGAGELIAIINDPRAFDITPMPEALTVEAFRNPVRKSTMYATTYEFAFGHNPFFNCAYIFAPSS